MYRHHDGAAAKDPRAMTTNRRTTAHYIASHRHRIWRMSTQESWLLDDDATSLDDVQSCLVAELSPTSVAERHEIEGLGAALWRGAHDDA
jgi:hypothetical protein